MNIISTVKNFVQEHDLFGDKALIVGCSGGPDSVALLRILCEIGIINIHVVHINHNLRGEDANEDEAFVVSLCKNLNVPCRVYAFDVEKISKEMKRSVEETGRILRYQAFDEYSKSVFGEEYFDKTIICLAHHKDDLAETMLMNLFRGSGIDGLIAPKVKTGRVCRPLLCVSKAELIEYLDSVNQDYRTDETNFISDCTRNAWRNDVIPCIEKAAIKNPSDALFSTYELLRDDYDYIEAECSRMFSIAHNEILNTLDISALQSCHRAIKSRIIRRLWLLTFGNLTDLEKVHVDSIIALIDEKTSSGTTIDLPFGRVAFVVDGNLGVCSKGDFVGKCRVIFVNKGFLFSDKQISLNSVNNLIINTELPHCRWVLSAQIVENNSDLRYNTNSWFYPLWEDSDAVDLQVGMLPSDIRFGRAGSDSHKKLGRLLMDCKVPVCIRSEVFGVWCNNDALWIPGIGHSVGFVDGKSYARFADTNLDRMPDRYLAISVSIGG